MKGGQCAWFKKDGTGRL